MTDNEQKAREYLKELKAYYTNLVIYGTIFVICLVVWLSTGGSFWPIWVLLAFAASSLIQGLKLGVFPMFKDLFPFLRPDWEEKRLKELFEDESLKDYNRPQHESTPPRRDLYASIKKDPTDDQGA